MSDTVGGSSNSPEVGAAGNTGGGEYCEYWFRSGRDTHAQPYPPTVAIAECERLRLENARVTAELLRVTAEATRAAAEAERLRVENARLAAEVQALTAKTTVATARSEDGAHTSAKLLISERVGSVSQEFLAGLTEEGKRRLDSALNRIVVRCCVPGISWSTIAPIIREELATADLQFAAKESFHNDRTGDWRRAVDVTFSDLMRIGFAVDNSRTSIAEHWYADEMIRIVKRLMELRGFV